MNTEREQHWQSILKISYKMLEMAHSRQWKDLVQLESTRRQLITAFFTQPVAAEDANAIHDGIHRILDIDQQIISLGKRRCEARGKLLHFRKHKRAVYKFRSRQI